MEPHEEGLDKKEWNKALDGYLVSNKIHPEVLEEMNVVQQWCINEIKKSIKRRIKTIEKRMGLNA